MEPVLEGWLVKSPPERKSVGSWKIFSAKWRRRYFVLYAPPTVESIPADTVTAMLEYYSSKKLHNKCGSIDLASCEEVYSALDSEMYKHVFCIQTTHKCRGRTYYLAAETEAEMNKWVNTLCRVLGLTESDDQPLFLPAVIEAKIQQILQPLTAPRPVTQLPLSMPKPRPNFATHPSAKPVSPDLPPLRTNTIGCTRLGGSEPNLLEALSPGRRDESGGVQGDDGSCMGSSLPGTGMRSAGSVPELDLLSPKRVGPNREQLPPVPPEKGASQMERSPAVQSQFGMEYDMPPQSYYNAPGGGGNSHVGGDGDQNECYNTPPMRYTEMSISAQGVTHDNDACYDVPPINEASKSAKKKEKGGNKHRKEEAVTEELYNVPPVHPGDRDNADGGGEFYENLQNKSLHKARGSSRDDSMRSRRSFPPHGAEMSFLLTDQMYDIPPSSELLHGHDGRKAQSLKPARTESRKSLPVQSGVFSACVSDETYDVPPPSDTSRGKVPFSQAYTASAFLGDQTYDTPPLCGISFAGKVPLDVKRSAPADVSKPRPVPAPRSMMLSEETYDVPPPKNQLPQAKIRTNTYLATAADTSSVMLGDQMYDVPPPKSIVSPSRSVATAAAVATKTTAIASSSLCGSADLHGLSRVNSMMSSSGGVSAAPEQIYNIPPSSVPPIPAKRNPPPPPKPPRPVTTVTVPMMPSVGVTMSSAAAAGHVGTFAVAQVTETKLQNNEIELPRQEENGKENIAEVHGTGQKGRFLQKESFHTPAGSTPPCIAKKGSNIEVRDSIRFTQRSKSFKRSLPSQQRSALPLPIKRVVERNESSSSDDDGSVSPASQNRSLVDDNNVQSKAATQPK